MPLSEVWIYKLHCADFHENYAHLKILLRNSYTQFQENPTSYLVSDTVTSKEEKEYGVVSIKGFFNAQKRRINVKCYVLFNCLDV